MQRTLHNSDDIHEKTKELIQKANAFSVAQRRMAGNTEEDFAYWHHLAVADTIEELRDRILELENYAVPFLKDLIDLGYGATSATALPGSYDSFALTLNYKMQAPRGAFVRTADSDFNALRCSSVLFPDGKTAIDLAFPDESKKE